MSERVAAPVADILVPEWGSAWPVLEVDGDRWTVLCFGRVRELSTEEVNLLHFNPSRNGIRATKGDRSTEAPPCPRGLKGAEWREWRTRRLQQIRNCRRMGWTVTGWKEESEEEDTDPEPVQLTIAPDPAPPAVDWSELETTAGAIFGPRDSEAALRLRARLRTDNPKHMAWQYHQKGPPPAPWIYPSGWKDSDTIWLPRGAMDWPADPVERSTGRALADGISPFWYQSEAVEAFLESGHGVVEAPCGAGKTGIGTFLAARLSGRVLVVCHTLELVRQWRDRLATWLPGVTVGQLGGGKKPKEEDIVVASLQTMARWKWGELEAFGRPFDLLICDECHHVPAETWIRVVAALPCRWRLGLTATPKRKDGLETWMHLALGETVYRIDQETLDSSGRTMAPRIHVLRTGLEVEVGDHPAATMRGVLEDPDRHRMVVDAVGRLVRDGRTVLVLTSLVDHAESFAADVGGAALVGRSSTRNRETVLEAVRAGELSVVVATQLADEGLDLPEVDAVVLVAPSSHKPATRQRIGRACRALEGKRTPIVVDVVDSGQWALRKWSARQSLYRSLGWPVGRWA